MADPPSYEESAPEYGRSFDDSKTESKTPSRFSIREEVGASRSQHVAALVAKLLPQIRNRAKRGLSKSTMLLLPSDQDASRQGRLVGFPEDDLPILIQLEGRQDTLEFWTQDEARNQLQSQMLAAISDEIPSETIEPPLPQRPTPPSATKSSFFGRKQGKLPQEALQAKPRQSPVTVDVVFDDVHFRAETEYGLYETLRCRGVLMRVEVR